MTRPTVVAVSLLAAILVLSSPVSNAQKLRPCPNHGLANGISTLRANGRFIKYKCLKGFKMFGDKSATCLRGVWEYQDQKPICVQNGCVRPPPLLSGQTDRVVGFLGAVLTFSCDPGYTLSGSPAIFCNSLRWNATIPTCITNLSESSTSCDFENGNLCGWSHDTNHHFDWTRNTGPTPSTTVSTGPSWDHTKGKGGSGYYMYIESSSPRMENDTARLVSPVFASELSSDACFIFYYHMFGLTTGTLNVYVKPEGQPMRPKIFSVSGQQGNKWVRAIVKFDPMDENFQIVVEGVRGSSYLGDSAIDDVRLGNETDCDPMATTTDISADTSTPFDADATQSCRLRCSTPPPSTGDDATVESQSDVNETLALTICECRAGCAATSMCCEDFIDYCIEAKTSQTSASATTFHRTVASSLYPHSNVIVVTTPMPPRPPKPSLSTPTAPQTSPTSPTESSTSPPKSSSSYIASRPSEKPTTLAVVSTQFPITVNNISSVTTFSATTTTPTATTRNLLTSKANTAVVVLTTTNSMTTVTLNVSTKPKPSTFMSVTTTLPTKTTILLTESTTSPSKATTSPAKPTSSPAKPTSLPKTSTTCYNKTTRTLIKVTPGSRRTPPPISWPPRPKITTKPTPSWVSETSTTTAQTSTTSKVSAKTKDEQNSANDKEMIAKETSYLENSLLLKERPVKNKDNTWQMAQRVPPSPGLSPLALYSGLAAGLCVVLVVGAATGIFLLRRRRTKLRRRFDDDSEVRFLTADEILDFNVAQPKDEDL